MSFSFNHKSKLSTVGTGNYIFRHFGQNRVAYYELDFIAASGTQWINPNLYPSEVGKVDCEFVPINVNSTWQSVIATEALNSPYNGVKVRISDGNKIHLVYGSVGYTSSFNASENTSYRVIVDGINDSITINNTTASVAFDNSMPSKPLAIFANGAYLDNTPPSVSQYGYIRLKYMKIYNTSGTLIRDYIPLMRVSDLEAGLYDLVNDLFYVNQGTGSFIPGFKIAGYSQLDFIQNSGSQFINTGIAVTNTTTFEFDCAPITASGDNKFFGAYDGTYGAAVGTYRSKWRLGSRWGNNNVSCTTRMTKIIGAGTSWTVGTTTATVAEGITALNNNMYMGCANYGNSGISGSGKFWYLKIDDNGVTTRRFIPMKKTSDNALGMYDIQNGVFYTNAGSGSFSQGSIIISDDGTDANIVYYSTVTT